MEDQENPYDCPATQSGPVPDPNDPRLPSRLLVGGWLAVLSVVVVGACIGAAFCWEGDPFGSPGGLAERAPWLLTAIGIAGFCFSFLGVVAAGVCLRRGDLKYKLLGLLTGLPLLGWLAWVLVQNAILFWGRR